jgi:carbon storage regulator CsrA
VRARLGKSAPPIQARRTRSFQEGAMLVLSRKVNEGVLVGDCLVKVLRIDGHKIVLGFDAPSDTRIRRTEIVQENTQAPELACA